MPFHFSPCFCCLVIREKERGEKGRVAMETGMECRRVFFYYILFKCCIKRPQGRGAGLGKGPWEGGGNMGDWLNGLWRLKVSWNSGLRREARHSCASYSLQLDDELVPG